MTFFGLNGVKLNLKEIVKIMLAELEITQRINDYNDSFEIQSSK